MSSSMVTTQQQECSNNNNRSRRGIWLPPGFRFHPTDSELITFYLVKKVINNKFAAHAVAEVDLNKFEPWDLPDKANMGEKEWYFFSLRDRKYPTGMRTNRATEAGYWKATGKDRDVRGSVSGTGTNNSANATSSLVGMKKTLVFYRGRAPRGEKTNWVMHEYRLEGKTAYLYGSRAAKEEWVVCRIFQKKALAAAKLRALSSSEAEDNAVANELEDHDHDRDHDVLGSPTATSVAAKPELDASCISSKHHQHHHLKNSFYSSGDFAKLFDPDFLPALNSHRSSTYTTNCSAKLLDPSACFKSSLAKPPCKSEPFAVAPPPPPPLADMAYYNAFAGLLGDCAFDQQSQQQQSQQQLLLPPSDQGLINELLFSRFLADPTSSTSSDLDQLYAF